MKKKNRGAPSRTLSDRRESDENLKTRQAGPGPTISAPCGKKMTLGVMLAVDEEILGKF